MQVPLMYHHAFVRSAGNNLLGNRVELGETIVCRWRFLQFAILDLYCICQDQAVEFVTRFNGTTNLSDICDNPLYSQSLRSFEFTLCRNFGLKPINIWDNLQRANSWDCIRWTCLVTFNKKDPTSLNYHVQHLQPQIEQGTNLYAHYLGSDRFLFVHINGLVQPIPSDPGDAFLSQFWNQHWGPFELFKKGIFFGGRRYVFLGGEMEKNISKSHRLRSVSSNNGLLSGKASDRCLVLWFVAIDNIYPELKSLNTIVPLPYLRNYFGHLTELPSSKCNARIKLGFSFVYPIEIEESSIIVVHDILGSTGKVMTDGCGLISADVVASIPYAVAHGVVRGNIRNEFSPLPSIIQVRCVSRKGLFKGCLLVTADSKLCTPGTVIFRESMKKSNKSPVYSSEIGLIYDYNIATVGSGDEWILRTKQKSVLGVVDTFEHPALLRNDSQREMSDFRARLNRSLCLLLSYLGVKRENLLAMMQGEIDQLSSEGNTTEDAFRLARSCLVNTREDGVNWYDREEVDDDEETDHTTVGGGGTGEVAASSIFMNLSVGQRSKICDPIYTYDDQLNAFAQENGRFTLESLAEKIIHFADAGHNVDEEPYFLQLYNRLKLQRYKFLSRCNVTVRNAIYLVGAADPYQYLEPGQVFILPPNDRVDIRCQTSFSRRPFIRSKVIVTRHPMQHPGDIREFKAVEHPLLMMQSRLPELTSGGVIFFSTKGVRAAGDEMSGGDYDGDRYLVLFGDQIVDYATSVPPNSDELESDLLLHVAVSDRQSPPPGEMVGARPCDQRITDQCSCQLCSDRLGCKIFRRLLIDAQEQNVGRFSNAWLAYADRNPMSREALLCGYIVRISLDAAKSGKRIVSSSDLLSKAPRLRHLRDEVLFENASLDLEDFPLSINTPTSTSGMISMKERSHHDPVMFRWQYVDDIDDDEVLLEEELLYNFNELHVLSRFSNDSITNRRSSATSSIYTSTNVSQKSIVQEMYEMIAKVLPTSPVQITKNSKLYIDWDLLIVEDDLPENNIVELCSQLQDIQLLKERIFDIFPKFHMELQEWHCRVKEYKMALHRVYLDGQRMGKNPLMKGFDISTMTGWQEIRVQHMQIFDKAASNFAKKFNVSHRISRLRLAGIVYLATYFNASLALESGKDPIKSDDSTRPTSHHQFSKSATLSYCWDICGHELHFNKKQMQKRRQKIPTLQTILRSVQYML